MINAIALLLILQPSTPHGVTLPMLLAGYHQNAQLIRGVRITYTKKTVLGDGYRRYHEVQLQLCQELLRNAQGSSRESLTSAMQRHASLLKQYEAMKVQILHFLFDTDETNFFIISPYHDIPWRNGKDSWSFPSTQISKKSLEDEYQSYAILAFQPKQERPYVYWVGAKKGNFYSAMKYGSFPAIGDLAFPPLTKKNFSTQATRCMIDDFSEVAPKEVTVTQIGKSPLYEVFCYGNENNTNKFRPEETEFQGRLQIRGESRAVFDTSQGFIPVSLRCVGRVFLDGKPIPGENGEATASMVEMKVSKIEKKGDVYYPLEFQETESVFDQQLAEKLTLKDLLAAKAPLRPRSLLSTKYWTVHNVQFHQKEHASFELPDNTLYADTALHKSFVTGKPDDFVSSMIKDVRPHSTSWSMWWKAGLAAICTLVAIVCLLQFYKQCKRRTMTRRAT